MNNFRWGLLFVSSLACASCKKNVGDNSLTGQLVGSWNWVLQHNNGIYSGNFTGNPFGDSSTPASTHIREVLTFTADGKWSVVRNGQFFEGGTCKIDSLQTPAGWLVPALDLVKSNGADSLVNHVIRNDTLIISNMLITTVGVDRIYVKQ
jgi:hypothetical protein